MGKVPGSKYESGNKSFRVSVLKKQQQLESLMRALPVETKQILDEIGMESKEEMQRIIKESESHYGLIRKSQGIGRGTGREDTGAMHDNVTFHTEQAADRISVRVGWLNKFEEYFGFQDGGFKQVRKLLGFWGGEPLIGYNTRPYNQEGIHALRDARMYAREKLNDSRGNLYSRLLGAYKRGK